MKVLLPKKHFPLMYFRRHKYHKIFGKNYYKTVESIQGCNELSIYITKDNVNISIQDISLKHKIIKDVSKEFPSFVLSEINQPKNTLLITYDEKSLSRDIKSALAKNLAI